MEHAIEAIYYDGQSSVSKKITFESDETYDSFILILESGERITWHAEDLKFEHYRHSLELRNSRQIGSLVRIDDSNFSNSFFTNMKQKKRVDIHTRLLHLGTIHIVGIAVCLFAMLAFAYFYILPPMAEKAAILLPQSVDDQIGEIFDKSFISEEKIDVRKTQYLQTFANELTLNNSKPLHFIVIKSNDINAFALPNGQIVVNTAIINHMKSYEELVALIGHEASHVNKRHSTRMLCRNLAGYMLVSLLMNDVNGIMTILVDNAQQIHSLSYSRNFEQEADELGLQIMIRNHIDPHGMVNLFDQLENNTETSVPKILSTHPLTKDRKKHMQQIILNSKYSVQSNDELKRIFNQITI